MNSRTFRTYVVFLLLNTTPVISEPHDDGFLEDIAKEFSNSDFVFPRAKSNAPMFPLAGFGASAYSDTDVKTPEGETLKYNVNRITQNALLPIQVGRRDALIVGEYLSYSRFDVKDSNTGNFDVGTVGIPVGWFRQANPSWQVAGFAMPMAHKSSEQGSDWSWQYLGGAFSRYEQSEHLWWAFGFYFDIAPGEDFYIPYIGASWTVNERWTLSAIMPWPGVVYSPTQDWTFRLGASPSGSTWSFVPEEDEISMNISTWDLGLSVDYRLHESLWFAMEAGYGGLGTLSISDSEIDEPDFELGSSRYFSISFKFRPELQ